MARDSKELRLIFALTFHPVLEKIRHTTPEHHKAFLKPKE